MKLKKLMHDFLQDYLNQNKIEFSEWSVNVNNQEGFGDYSSNIALKLKCNIRRIISKPFLIVNIYTPFRKFNFILI